MSKVKAEAGYEFPGHGRGSSKYPWREMNVGESFPVASSAPHANARIASTKYAPKVFKARKLNGSYRVWRIA